MPPITQLKMREFLTETLSKQALSSPKHLVKVSFIPMEKNNFNQALPKVPMQCISTPCVIISVERMDHEFKPICEN